LADDVESYAWFSVAAVSDVDFEKNRDLVEESLSGSQSALGQEKMETPRRCGIIVAAPVHGFVGWTSRVPTRL